MELTKEEIEAAIDEEINKAIKKYGKEIKLTLINFIGLTKLLNTESKEHNEKTRLIPLVKWNDYHPDPSVKALRMLVFRKDENGFDSVVERRGKRILINEKAYFEWKAQHS